MNQLIWWVPENKGGIESYTNALWPYIVASAKSKNWPIPILVQGTSKDPSNLVGPLIKTLKSLNQDQLLLHIQHEYGLFGGKIPYRYQFPKILRQLKSEIKGITIVATAHTVIDPNFKYDTKHNHFGHTSVRNLLKKAANQFFLNPLKRLWNENTWSSLDGCIVHSDLQKKWILQYGCKNVSTIAHFIPKYESSTGKEIKPNSKDPFFEAIPTDLPWVTVFGYFTPDKGQSLAIEAWSEIKGTAYLILAGGVRNSPSAALTKRDKNYLEHCSRLIKMHDLSDSVFITGFVPDEKISTLYKKSKIVLAPFQSTAGSGSLAHAIANASVILTSDLALNLEISDRVPNSLYFYKANNVKSLQHSLKTLLAAPQDLYNNTSNQAKAYAQKYTPEAIVENHFAFYEEIK